MFVSISKLQWDTSRGLIPSKLLINRRKLTNRRKYISREKVQSQIDFKLYFSNLLYDN